MFLVTGAFKAGWMFFGLACSAVPIGYFIRPDTFKTIYSNLFETKYLEFLVYKSNSVILDKTNEKTATAPVSSATTNTIAPEGATHLDYLKSKNKEKRDYIDSFSKSEEELRANGRKNYKCSIPLIDKNYSVFDVDCLIYKIKKNVTKSSEILHNLELVNSKEEVEHDQMYVLKINENNLKTSVSDYNDNQFKHDRNMVVEVMEKSANEGKVDNRMFYLNLTYSWTKEDGWYGKTNISLVTGSKKDDTMLATANDEKLCKNLYSNPIECIVFKIGKKDDKEVITGGVLDVEKLNWQDISNAETNESLKENEPYVVYYPNNRFGVPNSISISRDYEYTKKSAINPSSSGGKIIELKYHRMLMGSLNIQDISKSQLFILDPDPKVVKN